MFRLLNYRLFDKGNNRMNIKFLLANCLVIIIFSSVANAQSNFNTFWLKFKTAVVKGDKVAVANLTSFPLGMPYGVKSVKSKADFIKRYNKIINLEANAKRCFQAKTPVKDERSPNTYYVDCTFKDLPESSDNRPILYYFTKTKFGWKFSDLDNVNE